MRRLSVPEHQKNTNQSPKEGLVMGLVKVTASTADGLYSIPKTHWVEGILQAFTCTQNKLIKM